MLVQVLRNILVQVAREEVLRIVMVILLIIEAVLTQVTAVLQVPRVLAVRLLTKVAADRVVVIPHQAIAAHQDRAVILRVEVRLAHQIAEVAHGEDKKGLVITIK